MHPAQYAALDMTRRIDRDDHAGHGRPGNAGDSGHHDAGDACYGAGYVFCNIAGDGCHDVHVCRRPGRAS